MLEVQLKERQIFIRNLPFLSFAISLSFLRLISLSLPLFLFFYIFLYFRLKLQNYVTEFLSELQYESLTDDAYLNKFCFKDVSLNIQRGASYILYIFVGSLVGKKIAESINM